jgi:hypothetical protein
VSWPALALAVAAVAVAARWYARRVDGLGRRRDFPLVGVVLLAAAYWRTVYPAMPGGYRSSACRPGGALDEHLPDAPWVPAGV